MHYIMKTRIPHIDNNVELWLTGPIVMLINTPSKNIKIKNHNIITVSFSKLKTKSKQIKQHIIDKHMMDKYLMIYHHEISCERK